MPSCKNKKNHNKSRKNGFTLAEVLITLGVIGVVAALTLPSVIQSYREKRTVEQVGVAYNLLMRAVTQMIEDKGSTIDQWSDDPAERGTILADALPKYLQVIKDCGTYYKYTTCFGKNYSNRFNEDSININSISVYRKYLLKNGFGISIRGNGQCVQNMAMNQNGLNEYGSGSIYYGTYQHACGTIDVDINGPLKPNIVDIDLFRFYIVKDGIVPAGSSFENIWTQRFDTQCLGNNPYVNIPFGCTAWIVLNKNMDYLHCPDKLGWDKASSCK